MPAKAFYKLVELIGFLGVLAQGAFKKRRLASQFDNRLSPDGQKTMFGFSSEPISEAHPVFGPGENRFLLRPPRIENFKCLTHMVVGGPEDRVGVRNARDIYSANFLDGH